MANIQSVAIGFSNINPILIEAFKIRWFWMKFSVSKKNMRTWMCLICGWIYDEEAGLPEEGIAPGTLWEDVPPNWVCPECGARKEDFELIEV